VNATATLGAARLFASASAVCPARGVAIHHVEGDMWGVFDGRDEERPFQLSGDRLTLEPRWESGGRQWVGIRVFERARPAGGT
jgi:hypothetical protein